MISSTTRVKRYSCRNEFGGYQLLLKEWRVCGIKVWSQEIDREEVPGWAEIQLGALGSTDWRSKFASYIMNVPKKEARVGMAGQAVSTEVRAEDH